MVGACAAIALALSCQTLWAVTAANASFTNPADLDFFEYHFPTVKKDAANPTYNFNVYNLPTSGSTSTMSLVQVDSLPTSPPITLQSGTVIGLAAVGPGGTPKAPMQLTLSTSQGGSLQVQFTLEFASDSVTAHPSIVVDRGVRDRVATWRLRFRWRRGYDRLRDLEIALWKQLRSGRWQSKRCCRCGRLRRLAKKLHGGVGNRRLDDSRFESIDLAGRAGADCGDS